MMCSGTCIVPLRFSCGSNSKVYSWNFQLAPVYVPLLGADFRQHFNLLVNIKGRWVFMLIAQSDVILSASLGPIPVFRSISYLSASQHVQKLLLDNPDIFSLDGFTALEPCHSVCYYHLLTNPGPLVYVKPQRLDPEKLSAAKGEFSSMEKTWIMRHSSSPWASPLHMVKKKVGGWRPCGQTTGDWTTLQFPTGTP